ncbi:MAG: arsenite methyltransferase [Actinomycetota bacterium]|nr:arsenite methyltransferase [Actinomycetota bacterium]
MSSTAPDPTTLGPNELRDAVRERYAAAARRTTQVLDGAPAKACCSGAVSQTAGKDGSATDPIVRDLYGEEAASTSTGALTASLGCGNPMLLADLRPGETVLDLGSGGGLDVLLSARRVGPDGKAYGLDMTPEMLGLARRNQAEAGIENVEFLSGTIEDIPLPDASVDVIISNCVINLSGDKDAVLREAFRVLKPGGRFAVSDIVLLRPLPDRATRIMTLWTGCVAGALLDTDYVARLTAAGFADATVEITHRFEQNDAESFFADVPHDAVPEDLRGDLGAIVKEADGATASAFIRAVKPV